MIRLGLAMLVCTGAGAVVAPHSGLPVGGSAVAFQLGNDLIIGSFAGDRILAVKDRFKRAGQPAR